jgi:tripartite-type tricarboxylate transporter receptor subunit TctC
MAEQGVAMQAGNWYGFVTPHGVPAAARDKLAAEFRKVAQSKAFQDKAYAMGVQADFRDAAQFSAFLKEEGERLGEVVRDRGIELKR